MTSILLAKKEPPNRRVFDISALRLNPAQCEKLTRTIVQTLDGHQEERVEKI